MAGALSWFENTSLMTRLYNLDSRFEETVYRGMRIFYSTCITCGKFF